MKNILNFIIKERISEQFEKLSEGKVSIGDIPSSVKIVKDGNSYLLYDFENEQLLGNIEISKSGDNWEVSGVASYPGFGPMMYEIAMMDIYPSGLMPDRNGNTTDLAYGVWEKFYHRKDVRKKENPDWLNIFRDNEKNFLANLVFYLQPSSEFKSLEFVKPMIINTIRITIFKLDNTF
jgi:hypothetical protein